MTHIDGLIIRHSTYADIPCMRQIFAHARQFMVSTGNPNQWVNDYPSEAFLKSDIDSGDSYVCLLGEQIVATFLLRKGIDPTYNEIYQGHWLNEEPYATIHRIASNGQIKGIVHTVVRYALSQTRNLRIDTHRDNLVMQHAIQKEGFVYCGIIHCWNGDERLAYQLTDPNNDNTSDMKYRTIIWDLDGTLMDTLQDLMASVNYALQLHGMPQRSYQEIRSFVGNGVKRLVELAVPDGTNNPLFEQVFTDFKSHYIVHCQDQTGLYPGIAETLKELKQRGIRMAIVSNKLQTGVTELVESQVKTVGSDKTICLNDYVEVAIGERPEIARKPAADMVNKAFEEMGISKEGAVYIGDSEVDLATAHNAGLPCISVLWGFRDKDFLLSQGADTFIDHPQQLLQ